MFEGLKKWWKRECEGDAILFRPQPPENRTELTPKPQPEVTPKKPMAVEMRQLAEERKPIVEKERQQEREAEHRKAVKAIYDRYIDWISVAANKGENEAIVRFYDLKREYPFNCMIGITDARNEAFQRLRNEGFSITQHERKEGGSELNAAFTISW
jgi:hypothetical protein